MFFLPAENPIFVADETIKELITPPDNPIMEKLLDYQTERNDEHKKIYLPPSVLKILLENNEGETKVQINNTFTSVITTSEYKATLIQELCLTGEVLKNDGAVVFITKDKEFYESKFMPALKGCGFSALMDFEDTDLFLKLLSDKTVIP